jgi:hypothetical protein
MTNENKIFYFVDAMPESTSVSREKENYSIEGENASHNVTDM